MRIVFRDVDVARRKASALKAALAGGTRRPNLTACRDAVARVYGYSRWAELKTYVGTASDGDDFARLDLERAAAAVSETLGVTRAEAEAAVAVVGFRSVRVREAAAAPSDALGTLFELARETGGVMVGTDGRIFVRNEAFFRHEAGHVTDAATLEVLTAFFAADPDDGRDRQAHARRGDAFGLVRRTRQDGLDVFYVYGVTYASDVREHLSREFEETLEAALRAGNGCVVLGRGIPLDDLAVAHFSAAAKEHGRLTLLERKGDELFKLGDAGVEPMDRHSTGPTPTDGILFLFDEGVTTADEAIQSAEISKAGPILMAAAVVTDGAGRQSVECLPVGGPQAVRPR